MISLIVAHDRNYLIGKDGWMPWHLPQDLKHFKEKTIGKKIVMGRKTFEALKKPLEKRMTYVLTHDVSLRYSYENVKVVHDLKKLCEEYTSTEEELVICGGAQIYEAAMPYVDEMWISLVDGNYSGDTYFPAYDLADWQVLSSESNEGFVCIHYQKKR